ncbi:MAG: methionine biosynthesis protein MetW [Planctomycetota bacterium]
MTARVHLVEARTPEREGERKRSFVGKLVLAVRHAWWALGKLVAYCRLRPEYPAKPLQYDDYWQRRDPVVVGSRFLIMASLVRPESRVLDIGCGEGTLLEHLVQTRQVQGVGVDISEKAVKVACARGLDARVADILKDALPDGEFDHVLCGELLEHVAEPERVLLGLKRILRGTLVVSLPNVGYYPDRCRLLCGRFAVQWLHHPAEHLRFFTVRDFREFAHDLGFRVVSLHAATGFPVLMRWWPNLFAQQVVYELEVRRD